MRTHVDLELPTEQASAHHVLSVTPRLSDIDFGGVVHHTTLLRYLEEARIELLVSRGFTFDQFAANAVIPVVSRLVTEFRRPVIHGHNVLIATTLGPVRSRTIEFRYVMRQQDMVCLRGATELMVTDEHGSALRLPDVLVAATTPPSSTPNA